MIKASQGLHEPQEIDDTLRTWIQEATELKAALDEHAIVAITDAQGCITFVNDKCCALAGYSREELLGQNHRIMGSGHHPTEFFREMWRTILRGVVWHGDIKNRAKDGSDHWLGTTIVPFLDDAGRPRQFVAISADITEQKRVEARLAEKQRLQQLLADLSARFVALPSEEIDSAIEDTLRLIAETLSLDRCTLWQLKAGERDLVCTHCWQRPEWPVMPPHLPMDGSIEWSVAKVMKGEILLFQSIDDLPPEASRDAALFRSYGLKSKITIPLLARGRVFGALAFSTLAGERAWAEDEVTELKLVTQIISNVVGRQRAELREDQLREELSHAQRVATLGELASALAHELNQPLAAILSNAQAARRFIADREFEQDELAAILDDIARDDKRAGAVIHNLRAMICKRTATREICCLHELVHEVVDLMRSAMLEAGIELRVQLAPALLPVEAARVELQQVLLNLLLNATHAMEQTPAALRFIEVATQEQGVAVVLSIRDRGHGISPERLDTIFDPFYSTKSSGLGVGLSICRRIIENHGGHIEARNCEDGGALFRFSIPTASPGPRAAA